AWTWRLVRLRRFPRCLRRQGRSERLGVTAPQFLPLPRVQRPRHTGPCGIDLPAAGEPGQPQEVWQGQLGRPQVPDPGPAALLGGYQVLAAGGERRVADVGIVLQGRGDRLAGGRLPYPRHPIAAGRDEVTPVRAESSVLAETLQVQGRGDRLLTR